MLVIHLVDIYAQKYHSGLGDIPVRRWEEAVQVGFTPRFPVSAEDLRIILGRIDYRTIFHYGIDLHSIRYNSPDLAPLRTMIKKHQNQTGTKVKVKWHPGDLSRIHVLDPFDEVYIEVPALDQEYTRAMSFWKHQVIQRFAKLTENKADLAALGRAKREIRQIVDQGKRNKRIAKRSRLARYERAGKTPSLQYEPKEQSCYGNPSRKKANVKKTKEQKPTRGKRETTEALDEPVNEGWTVEIPLSEDRVDD